MHGLQVIFLHAKSSLQANFAAVNCEAPGCAGTCASLMIIDLYMGTLSGMCFVCFTGVLVDVSVNLFVRRWSKPSVLFD